MTDEAALIADTARAFPNSMMDVDKAERWGGLSVHDYYIAIGSTAAGVGEVAAGGNPWAFIMGAAVLARPTIREMLTSQFYQRRAMRPRNWQPSTRQLVTSGVGDTAGARGVSASLAAQAGGNDVQ